MSRPCLSRKIEGGDGAPGFLPTFKMQRGRRYDFFSQRVPSFTDRVLWKSAPGSGELPCFAAPRHWHTTHAFAPKTRVFTDPKNDSQRVRSKYTGALR